MAPVIHPVCEVNTDCREGSDSVLFDEWFDYVQKHRTGSSNTAKAFLTRANEIWSGYTESLDGKRPSVGQRLTGQFALPSPTITEQFQEQVGPAVGATPPSVEQLRTKLLRSYTQNPTFKENVRKMTNAVEPITPISEAVSRCTPTQDGERRCTRPLDVVSELVPDARTPAAAVSITQDATTSELFVSVGGTQRPLPSVPSSSEDVARYPEWTGANDRHPFFRLGGRTFRNALYAADDATCDLHICHLNSADCPAPTCERDATQKCVPRGPGPAGGTPT